MKTLITILAVLTLTACSTKTETTTKPSTTKPTSSSNKAAKEYSVAFERRIGQPHIIRIQGVCLSGYYYYVTREGHIVQAYSIDRTPIICK